MKDKITMFVIGLLLGAIISTASIYFYTLANNSNDNNQNEMRMERDFQENNGMGGNGGPPEIPNENN